ncbi:Similar to Venom metalloproteinase 1 (Eulophus pennicornis) [Cotesia congregata]|uniref:Similar to Venom metalloproteinase 1 (Eulophus pennicornis) n=1 Tax=Cotesia congregata TaxID=51543 RepID=A0A8J2HH80_COTCN|nr:Similar to Venom metalloproteinase 1 (Eulophus pennicornis) [Cotesia congregata]
MNPYEKRDPITKLPILRNGSSALRNKGKWLYQINKKIPISSYDVAITMFTNNICPEGLKIAKSKCINIGLACTSCACYTEDHYNITYKVGFVQDLGNYWGIQTAAHELGHLFGSYHDNITENGCRNEDNYIMATSNWKTENSFDWSNCSISQMNSFFK